MKRHLLLFGLVVVAVFGLGYVVFSMFIVEQPQSSTPPPQPTPPSKPTSQLPPSPKSVLVSATQGLVERKGPDETEWHPVSVGESLRTEESIKTGKDASAKLQVDEKSEVDLAGFSEMTVREISETVHRFRLVRGKIGVDYDASGERLIRVESPESHSVAESRAGKFVVQSSAGIVSVATTTGEVKLTARNKTIVVAAGNLSRVVPGEAPRPVEPLPLAIMLRVANPQKLVQREHFTFISGKTSAGARVLVNDTEAKVSLSGHFRIKVPLKVGENRLVVVAEDAAGNKETKELPTVIVDESAPIDRMNIRWGEKAGPG